MSDSGSSAADDAASLHVRISKEASVDRALGGGVLLLLLAPVVLLAAALVFVGMRALADPRNFGDLVVCLWAGLAIFATAMLGVWFLLVRLPSITIQDLRPYPDSLTCTTPRDGERTFPLSTLRSLAPLHRRHGRGISGWWVRFEGGGWLWLRGDTERAVEVVKALQSQATK